MIRVQILALVLSLGLLGFVVEMVRRKRLLEQYSLLWIAGALSLSLFAAWPGLMDRAAPLLGIAYAPAALFLAGLFVLVLLALHFSLVISRLSRENRILAQRLARLEAEEADRGPDRAAERPGR